MFDSLSERLEGVFKRIKGQGRLDENNIQEGLREVRLALLEADVNYKVVKDFVAKVKERSLGQDVLTSLTPGQQVIKIVQEELVELLGGDHEPLAIHGPKPLILMLVGLQGSGKTTTAAKLALYLQNLDLKPYLVPADVYRPAAIDQLHKLAGELEVPAYPSSSEMNPVNISKDSIQKAQELSSDVIILDTAGRLHIDQPLMRELSEIKQQCNPREVLLVADAMTGQDAVNVAEEFNQLLDLTGVILTKLEGDARGGAALSIRSMTHKPIKFVGVGEKLKDLEAFYPDRIASRILGMGDMLTLIEKAQKEFDDQESEALEKKFQKAEFNLEDFRNQMRKIKKLGSIDSLLKLVPGMGKIRDQLQDTKLPEDELTKVEAVINSMTKKERKYPKVINSSRKERIAKGSGTTIQDVNQLLKNFNQMQKMLKKFSGKGQKALSGNPGLGGMPGIPGMEQSEMFSNPGIGSNPSSTKKKKDRKKKKLRQKGKKKKKK